jgi:hypothetical protein
MHHLCELLCESLACHLPLFSKLLEGAVLLSEGVLQTANLMMVTKYAAKKKKGEGGGGDDG